MIRRIDRRRAAEEIDGALFFLSPAVLRWVLTGKVPSGFHRYTAKARVISEARENGWFRAARRNWLRLFLFGGQR